MGCGCLSKPEVEDHNKHRVINTKLSDDEREARRKAQAEAAEKRAHEMATKGGVTGQALKEQQQIAELQTAFRILSGDARCRYEDEQDCVSQPVKTAVKEKGISRTSSESEEEYAAQEVQYFADVAPVDLQVALDQRLREKAGWAYQGVSNDENGERRFWYQPLLTKESAENGGYKRNDPLTRRLWEDHLKPLLGGQFTVLRAYANGQTFGQDGSPHRDACPSPPHYTLLYYTHNVTRNSKSEKDDAADVAVGGETFFWGSKSGRKLAAVPARANSAIVFPGCLLHSGAAPAERLAENEMRITVAFKLRKEDGT